jgi:hypothetical protein
MCARSCARQRSCRGGPGRGGVQFWLVDFAGQLGGQNWPGSGGIGGRCRPWPSRRDGGMLGSGLQTWWKRCRWGGRAVQAGKADARQIRFPGEETLTRRSGEETLTRFSGGEAHTRFSGGEAHTRFSGGEAHTRFGAEAPTRISAVALTRCSAAGALTRCSGGET